jgi:hypothetical protein
MKMNKKNIIAAISSSVRSSNASLPSSSSSQSWDIFLRGFSLSSCPQHSLQVLLHLNPTRLLKYILSCENNFPYFDPV